jgi:glycosyltransferase involved in cell wall biosynthesis
VLAAEKSTRADAPRFAVTVQAYEAEYLVDLARWGAFVDVCVTSGHLVADAVQRFANLPAERVRSIPGGVAPARRMVVHRADAPLRIGYVGRLDDVQKRAGDLISFVAELDARAIPYTLDVAGDGPAANALRSALPRASFLGWLTTDALYDRVYPELDVLVHFAAWEGITIAPREAMAHGVVPVISRFTGLAAEGQFVDEVNALTFDVGDVGAAADAVARLARDRELLERLARAARESQGGINSEEGAARAWAEAFDLALQLPPRIGATMPVVPRASGRLAFLPEALAEVIRRRRPMQHNDPGGEWPHWSGERDEALMQAIAEYAR